MSFSRCSFSRCSFSRCASSCACESSLSNLQGARPSRPHQTREESGSPAPRGLRETPPQVQMGYKWRGYSCSLNCGRGEVTFQGSSHQGPAQEPGLGLVGRGGISSSWSQVPSHQGGPRGPTDCSRGEDILSSGVSLDLFHFNRSRMRAPGEGSEGIKMGRNGHPAASSNSLPAFQFGSCPHLSALAFGQAHLPQRCACLHQDTPHWAGSQKPPCAQLAPGFHGQVHIHPGLGASFFTPPLPSLPFPAQ